MQTRRAVKRRRKKPKIRRGRQLIKKHEEDSLKQSSVAKGTAGRALGRIRVLSADLSRYS